MVIKDIAITVPGMAYPMPAGNVMNFKSEFLFWRTAKVSIKENIIVIKAVINPRPIVLKVRISKSKFKPLCIWSIFKKNQNIGIPIEKSGGNIVTNTASTDLMPFNSHPSESDEAGFSLQLLFFLRENF